MESRLTEPFTLSVGVADQIRAWADQDPSRVAAVLDLLRDHRPDLWRDLVLSAVATERLGLDEGARALDLDHDGLTDRLIEWRRDQAIFDSSVVCGLGLGHAARLAESAVPIWEIVREFRRHQSFDQTVARIPHLRRLDVLTALDYARCHPQEIETCVAAYEAHLERVRGRAITSAVAPIP